MAREESLGDFYSFFWMLINGRSRIPVKMPRLKSNSSPRKMKYNSGHTLDLFKINRERRKTLVEKKINKMFSSFHSICKYKQSFELQIHQMSVCSYPKALEKDIFCQVDKHVVSNLGVGGLCVCVCIYIYNHQKLTALNYRLSERELVRRLQMNKA